ncbi:LPS export ABC transporter permease LptG [Rhodothalassium salexigens]|uniref:LPS export ABC transporter permease LptG n=1 Tax=Rhodothalassium salexigens TaxID=1086 RepID=UPI0019121481|nr:LPS export ABC transporter permease LptG [Rhodothalassium salexigens]MBK5920636.1 LPS export ABC transporter permease LptG [Rhodothalassium salexigens]
MTRPFKRLIRLAVPSPTLAGYLARQLALRFAIVLALIVVVLQLLDLMATSEDLLAGEGAGRGALLRYVVLRVPQLVDQFVPFAALLGVLFTLSTLRQSSELTVMRGTGLSPHRLLLPLGGVCLAIAIGHFLFFEGVVVDASNRLKYWQQNDYAADLPPRPDIRTDIWLTQGDRVIHVEALSRSGSRVILDQVTVYGLGADSMVRYTERADFAWYDKGEWRLFGVRRFGVDTLETTAAQSAVWDLGLTPDQFLTRNVDPDVTELGTLREVVASMAQQGRDAAALSTALFSRISGPAATLVMPLMGAVAGAGAMRRGRGTARLLVGMALGFSYFVAENFMLAMGELGSVPPAVAAFAPLVFFALLGLALIFLTEE